MPKEHTPGEPGGITTRVKLQKKPGGVNTNALASPAGAIGETPFPVNAIPFTREAEGDGATTRPYQIALIARWPFPIQIDFWPGALTSDRFAEQIRGALAEAEGYLDLQIRMIARQRTLGVDKGAPRRQSCGLTIGHSFGPQPIFMDVRIDTYAVTPAVLRGKTECLVGWMVSALDRLRKGEVRNA